MSQYPPLKSLLAFNAVMECGSFSIAAKNLSVTPGAISQHIQKLEEWLVCPLFIREIRQIKPTNEAIDYWKEIQPALASLQRASHTVRNRNSSEVRLSMPPSLAAKWFAPYLADLLCSPPDISLHLLASTALVNFETDAVDLAIRYFDGNDDTLDSTLLFLDEARAYCSPAYRAQQALEVPADLLRTTLLHSSQHPHWPAWLSKFAMLSKDQTASIPSAHFNQTQLAIETTKQGRGIVLCSELLVRTELEQHQLIEPFPCALALSQA